MTISSCLKLQMNDLDPIIVHFKNHDFDTQSASIDDLRVFAHLSIFFPADTYWHRFAPPPAEMFDMASFFILGATYNSNLLNGHPTDSHSMACFSKEKLKDFLTQGLISINPDIAEVVKNASLSEIQSILESNGIFEFLVIDTPITMKVLRCTRDEIKALDPYGAMDFPYTDAFDLVKERLANRVPVLESNNLTIATYVEDGDYIEFYAECGLTINLGGADDK